jgi:hypothetical protein
VSATSEPHPNTIEKPSAMVILMHRVYAWIMAS